MTNQTCSPDSCIFDEQTEYKRDLGLFESISIVVGRIIGSGIFRTPGPIMAAVSCTSLFALVWIIGGIVTIFHAVCYAELVAMMPRSGGPYVYLKTAYGSMVAFLRGWAMFFVSETGAIAAVALVFAEYLNEIWKIVSGVPLSHVTEILLALAIIWVLTAVNLFGVFMSGIFQNVFSILKIAAIGIIIGISFTAGGKVGNFLSPFLPAAFSWETIMAIGTALRLSFFAFSGWEGATYIAEEVKNPRKNLPLSLLLGIAGVLILFVATNLAYLYQLSPAEMAKSHGIAADAMKAAIGGVGGVLISVAVMLSTFGNVSTQILCKARTWQAMSRDGLFFDAMSPLHERFRTPNRALVAQASWASVILLALMAVYLTLDVRSSASYETIIAFFSATGTIFNLMTINSIFVFRKKYPNVTRPYKAWLYPYSVIIVSLLLGLYLVITLITAFIPSLVGLFLMSTGLIYYRWKQTSRKVTESVK
ncbi:MAG TPA: amino acid permease [Spirochaetota bacterium]|nr:amino acid permease [Spirochaetota bacterium]HPN11956.1 amino acid permease [Spirochaetota bacterium]